MVLILTQEPQDDTRTRGICSHFEFEVSGYKMRRWQRCVYSRDAVLVQCVQGSVAVLSGGSLIHVPEALHGGDVPLDALLGEVQLGDKCQRSAVVAAEQHGATVVALRMQARHLRFIGAWEAEEEVEVEEGEEETGDAYRGYEAVL